MRTDGDGDGRDDLVAPEGVNTGGPVVDPDGPRVTDPEHPAGHEDDRGGAPAAGGDQPPTGDNGQLLSGSPGSPPGRPPQPGQEVEVGEG